LKLSWKLGEQASSSNEKARGPLNRLFEPEFQLNRIELYKEYELSKIFSIFTL
jgi:hypothetical protein